MKITKTELAKIVKEETEAYLSEYDETPDEDPESWYSDASSGAPGEGMTRQKTADTAKGAAMALLDLAKTGKADPAIVEKQANVIMDMLVSLEQSGALEPK